MADQIPIKRHVPEDGLAEFTVADSVGLNHGGTGANDLLTAQTNLGIVTSVALINAQPHVVYDDTTRLKTLSTSLSNYLWAESAINNTEWIQIAHATHSRSGHVMPFNGTIVGMVAHCENTGVNSKPLNLFIDAALTTTNIITIPSNGTDSQVLNMTLDIDFNQGQKLRLRANGGGTVQDTVISMFIRWRV
jgi:hypothetical protein